MRIEHSDPISDISQQINKRLTLNLLIQGAAAHTFITASHLAKDELEKIRPGLTELYSRFSICGQLNYCIGDNALVFGRPNRWWGISPFPQKAFRRHRLLARYGNALANQEIAHLKQLAQTKNVSTRRFKQWLQMLRLMNEVLRSEAGFEHRLEPIALRIATEIWGIPASRLDGRITRDVAFGNLQVPRTAIGKIARSAVVGYGGVEQRRGQFTVVARAWVFPLLVHELVKGIMELISLHGLSQLDDEVYQAVIDEADQLEYEAWLLQAGPAMWRRFLATAPRDIPLPQLVMHIAKLDPQPLEELMLLVMEEPNRATDQMRQLAERT